MHEKKMPVCGKDRAQLPDDHCYHGEVTAKDVQGHMEAKHRQLLLRCRSELQSDIASTDQLLDTLIEEDILSPRDDDYQAIRILSTPAEQTRVLLDLLPTLGPKAYPCFVRSLRRVRPHLAELLERREAEMKVENGGRTPPCTPRSRLAQRAQGCLRKSYLRLARKTTVLDYGRSTRPRGLHDVYVTVSSLDFDEVQEMRRQKNTARHSEAKRGDGLELESKTFCSRCGDAMELALRRLLRFEDGRCADSCLVVGPGGVGKTLLLQWLMVSWAEGRVEELSNFEFVIYVSGRDLEALESNTAVGVLQAILRRYGMNGSELEELSEYLKENSSRLLVLLDSADEGSEAWSRSEGLQMLLERRSLEECSLIVTSRPCSLAYDLVPLCMLRYYIVGFSDEHLDELLLRRLDEKGREVVELLRQESRSHLRELMKSTPILANMVAELAVENIDGLPLTVTETYNAMSMNMVYRQMYKAASGDIHRSSTASFQSLGEDGCLMFDQLGEMALDGLKRRCFVFDVDEVRRRCGDLALEIGVLEEYEYFSVGGGEGVCHQVQFRHLSWQEYFAAHALTQQVSRKRTFSLRELFRLHREDTSSHMIKESVEALGVGEEMELFWRFVAGHAKSKQLQTLMEALHTAYRRQGQSWAASRWLLFACSCLAEAVQQPLTGNLSKDDKVKYVQAAAAVLPQNMDLSNTVMSMAEVKTLSVALEYAPHVLKLGVHGCALQAAHFRVLGGGMTHLKVVYMHGNRGLHGDGLAALAESSMKCELAQLNELYLDHCDLDASDCTVLESLLFCLPSLTGLNLLGNRLGSLGLANLRKWLVKSKLERVRLDENDLDSDASHVLGDVIQNSEHLRSLYVTDNDLGNSGVEHIMEGVAKNHSLKLLDLSRTGIDDDILHCVPSALSQRSTELMMLPACPLTIHLHGNHISQAALQQLADQLSTNCRDQVESDSTVIENGEVHDRDYSVYFKEYIENDGTGDLDLSDKGINDNAVTQQVSSFLADGRYHVEALNLSYNSVGNEGAVALASALQVNTSLKGLCFDMNNIGVVGFSALATSLTTSNRSLLFLSLYGNPVFSDTPTDCDEEGKALQRLVSESGGLRYIGLGGTGLGDDGCKAIGESLSHHHGNLMFLDLSHNEISNEGVAALCHGMKGNKTVTYLNLSFNEITSTGTEVISRCLQFRREQGSPLQVWMGGNPVTTDCLTECMLKGECGYTSITNFITKYLQ